MAPQAAATRTSRHGSFSFRSRRRTTKSANAVVGRQASVQMMAAPGPAEPAKTKTSLNSTHSSAARPRRTPARTRWRARVFGSRSRSKARTATYVARATSATVSRPYSDVRPGMVSRYAKSSTELAIITITITAASRIAIK